ncbi:FliG C-terminal domain-containing protein [Treponema sp. UBA3813]|uniref:FliG C-terminal domain-containing protein n=1 Tax=Treponema sp. UBA3813 TaxID=1947715 RepID=UPI0025D8A6AA|nr:FliG C-terminal domain-containing protein [Treponema sp. UBA3813]
MEKIISLNDNQVEKIDIIDNYFVQKQNELRLAMWQTERIYSDAPEFFEARTTGKIFVGNQNEPLIVFPDTKSELFSEKHLVTAKVMSSLTDNEFEETIEFCASMKRFLCDWTWSKANTVPNLDKDSVRLEISLVFVSFHPSSYREFTFDDILRLKDSTVQKLLTKIDTVDLLNALKSASSNIQNKFLFNMSKRAAQMVREDMDYIGEVKLQDSYNSQQKILEAIQDLGKSGEIEIPKLTYADRNEK